MSFKCLLTLPALACLPCPACPLACRCKGVFEINGERWVRMVVIGQSFMLHQIRKLVRGAGREHANPP